MYSRIYTAVFEEVIITAPIDFFQIEAPTDAIVVLHNFELSQSSDAGDAEDEMLDIFVHRGTVSGTGGSTVTPRPHELGGPAFGGIVQINNTVQATEGVFLYVRDFNIHHGMLYMPSPETRIVISPIAAGGNNRLVVELRGTTPADGLTMNGSITFEEKGG